MAIDRLPSERFRARLTGSATRRRCRRRPTPASGDRGSWRRGAASVTFAAYATGWLAGFVDDAPDRARFEAALEHRLDRSRGSNGSTTDVVRLRS